MSPARRAMTGWLRAMVLAGVALLLGSHGAGAAEPNEAAPAAPAYAARVLGRDASVSLSSLRGKAVLLNAWATWCVPCLQELGGFESAYQRLRTQGLVVVAVSIDEGESDERVRQYVKGLKLHFPVWRDPANQIGRAFGIRGVPESFLIDREGRIAHHWRGPVDLAGDEANRILEGALKGAASTPPT